MGRFTVLTVSHDRIHDAVKSDNLETRLFNLVSRGVVERGVFTHPLDRLPGIEVAYTEHNDTCPVLAFSHGRIKGVLGSLDIPRHDDKTLDDYLVTVAKRRGFVIYKKGDK